ncbi:hypothetical protein MANES_13G061750v8 [Manihot esculenta]|uniref:Uncharacterized protein n=1 Tax=Manihot esculenta TaxID=3983 RepID=A0ACB7GKI6_MANES|nr:hypothetical protein MANES_13G061750v8 [Manihot esculenta]
MNMISKKLTFICLIILVWMLLAREANAKLISNDAMRRNIIPGCSPKYPRQCHKQQVNPYQRGCPGNFRCRSSNSKTHKVNSNTYQEEHELTDQYEHELEQQNHEDM